MALAQPSNLKRLVLLVWALVAFFYFYLSYDYIRVTMNDREFNDYLQHIVQVAGSERRPEKDVRDLLLLKAGQLSLPVRRDQIAVHTNLNSLDVAVNYDVDIEVPLTRREIYTKKFEHKVKYQAPR
jgi:hypothetical protein